MELTKKQLKELGFKKESAIYCCKVAGNFEIIYQKQLKRFAFGNFPYGREVIELYFNTTDEIKIFIKHFNKL